MAWKKVDFVCYSSSETEFKISILPTRFRFIVMILFYAFIGLMSVNFLKDMTVFILMLILALWPLLQDLKAAYPVTINRDGRIRFLFTSKKIEHMSAVLVYSLPIGRFPQIGLISKEIETKSLRLKLKVGSQESQAFETVAEELAAWLGVTYRAVNHS